MKTQLLTPIDYDKISDDLYWLSKRVVLRFNVTLARQTQDGNRVFYHKEFMFNTTKYLDKEKVVMMRRSFQFYLSIDDLDNYENNTTIGVQDIILFRTKLHEASLWFTNGVFGEKNHKLIIKSKPNPIVLTGLPYNKFITFEPIVIEYDNATQQQGVRIVLSDITYVDVSIDRFYGLFYLVNSINMYQSAQLMLNYLGRPNLGCNMYEFTSSDSRFEEPEPPEMKAKKRTIRNGPRAKSFFDSIDDLEKE